MNWKEQLAASRNVIKDVPEDRARVYEKEKEATIPMIAKEEERPFEQVYPQPVISPGIYEAEFMTKGRDVIFHFWPYGYHEADDLNKVLPRFPKTFPKALKETMQSSLSPTEPVVEEDRDMGAWFVKAKGMADRPFARDIAIKAMEELHRALGGE